MYSLYVPILYLGLGFKYVNFHLVLAYDNFSDDNSIRSLFFPHTKKIIFQSFLHFKELAVVYVNFREKIKIVFVQTWNGCRLALYTLTVLHTIVVTLL